MPVEYFWYGLIGYFIFIVIASICNIWQGDAEDKK